MTVFNNYAKYYDLLYADKQYQFEADFVHGLLLTHAIKPIENILELGAGTGKHAYHLAEKGYYVNGVDQSNMMLEMAGNLIAKAPAAIANKIQLEHGDIRNLSLDKKFDAAISLFHVMSYQITNLDLEATFASVKAHVNAGGLFIFDCWYGPAVLANRPVVRFKQFQNDELTIERMAVPTLYENDNTVKVHYHLFVKENASSQYQKLEEEHFMRYLFLPEIERLCHQYGMKLIHSCEWLSSKALSLDSFGACFVVKL